MRLLWKVVVFPSLLVYSLTTCMDINRFYVNKNKVSQMNPTESEYLVYCVMQCNMDEKCHSGGFDITRNECATSSECKLQDIHTANTFELIDDTREGNTSNFVNA